MSSSSSSSSSSTQASTLQAFCSSDGFVLHLQHQCLHVLYNLTNLTWTCYQTVMRYLRSASRRKSLSCSALDRTCCKLRLAFDTFKAFGLCNTCNAHVPAGMSGRIHREASRWRNCQRLGQLEPLYQDQATLWTVFSTFYGS